MKKPEEQLQREPEDFDQAADGWRELAMKGDERGAIDLIEQYIQRNNDLIEPGIASSIHFHLGQMYAFVGENEKAIKALLRSQELYPTEDGDLYSGATIAFLRGDVTDLELKVDEYSKTAQGQMRGNIPILENLLRDLKSGNMSYKSAYGSEVSDDKKRS